MKSSDMIVHFTFNLLSGLDNAFTRKGIAPASTTVSARSLLCLLISNKADALICLRYNSGSCKHKTKSGTAPASTTASAKFLLCLAIYPTVQAAASLTPESKSSKQSIITSNALF